MIIKVLLCSSRPSVWAESPGQSRQPDLWPCCLRSCGSPEPELVPLPSSRHSCPVNPSKTSREKSKFQCKFDNLISLISILTLHQTMQNHSYLTNRRDRVEFTLDGCDSINEGWAEDDAMSSVCKIGYLGQLIKEPGTLTEKGVTTSYWQAWTSLLAGAESQCVCQLKRYWLFRFVQQLHFLLLWCLIMFLDSLQLLRLHSLPIKR